MLSCVRRQRDKIERIEAEADTLIHSLDVAAYSAARRRKHEASSETKARQWRTSRSGRHAQERQARWPRASTRIATDADLTPEGDPGVSSRPLPDSDPLDELQRLVHNAMTRPDRAPKPRR
jgi:hypothetical protein